MRALRYQWLHRRGAEEDCQEVAAAKSESAISGPEKNGVGSPEATIQRNSQSILVPSSTDSSSSNSLL